MSCQDSSSTVSDREAPTPIYIPDQALGELFPKVQVSGIFDDYKTFVDSRPLRSPELILADYLKNKDKTTFELKTFVRENFEIPDAIKLPETFDFPADLEDHLNGHWDYLTRSTTEQEAYSTAIALPFPYVVPGGRFREMFYWDSYFIILGLLESDRDELALGMLKNFEYLIDTFGFIPNGNRSYFLTRSQPPLFAAGLMAYGEKKGTQSILPFLPALEKEYQFWMRGESNIKNDVPAYERVVKLAEGTLLNRYFGAREVPRAEAYGKEIKWAEGKSPEEQKAYYRHMRAACESGWDFSSRWFKNPGQKSTCHTMDIIPICLNSLLFNMETLLASLHELSGNQTKAGFYTEKANSRQAVVNAFLWDEKSGIYRDYDYIQKEQTDALSLAMAYPLYVNMASQEQAEAVAKKIKKAFLFPGGVVTTLGPQAEQWDYPNGWAPLQWITIKGLLNYGYQELALEIARRWLQINQQVYDQDKKMMEKYNVVQPELPAGGGEYPNQDGFGWTNAIALKCMALLKE